MMLTPEYSMQLQNVIGSAGYNRPVHSSCSFSLSGADIMMALDDVVSTVTTGPRVEEAMHRTLRWIDRCISAHQRPREQNLYGIVQGALDSNLRHQCLDGLIHRDLPGYAIGGLSGGESKDDFWKIVTLCTDRLPADKPRYLMGVGFPVDLVVCVALGVDQFDCVYPSRTARFGTALVRTGVLHLKASQYELDFRPIEEDCGCMVCKNYTRSYLHALARKEQLGGQLLTYHNIAYQMRLMKDLRAAIIDGSFPNFVQRFMELQYPDGKYDGWVIDALASVGIRLRPPTKPDDEDKMDE